MNPTRPLASSLSLMLLLGACSGGGATGNAASSTLASRYPAVATWLADAERQPPEPTSMGFRIRSRPAPAFSAGARGRWMRPAPRVVLDVPSDGSAAQVGIDGEGFRVGVHRRAPGTTALEGGTVVVRGADLDAVIFARGDRIEELWHAHGAAPLGYDLDLPAGFSLRRSPTRPGLVEVRDAHSEARLRLWLDAAWDAEGRSVHVEAIVEGSHVTARLPPDVVYPVLADPSWEATAAMSVERGQHTATPLADGTVLVTGGYVSGAPVAEIFDPFTATFTETMGPPTQNRENHTATVLRDGRVLVVGGANGDLVSELYDPATGRFTPGPQTHVDHAGHTATLLWDGRVVIGDVTAEVYDPATSTFGAPAQLKNQFGWPPLAARLPDDDVLLVGQNLGSAAAAIFSAAKGTFGGIGSLGVPETATLLADHRVLVGTLPFETEGLGPYVLYDPTSESTEALPLTVPNVAPTATLLRDGTVLVAGGAGTVMPAAPGDAVTRLDPSLPASLPAPPMTTPRVGHTATLLLDGSVLVAGGYDTCSVSSGNVITCHPTATAERFDPGEDTTVASGPLPYASGAPDGSAGGPLLTQAAVRLPDGRVLLTGGAGAPPSTTAVATAQLLDGTKVVAAASMGFARAGHTMTMLPDQRVLVAGGAGDVPDEIFDPKTSTFTKLSSKGPQPLVNHTATLLPSGKVLLVGAPAAEVFDPSGTYATSPDLASHGRIGHTATLLPSGEVLIAGGYDAASKTFAPSELFHPSMKAFAPAAGKPPARAWHTATLLPTGQVLIAGGSDTGALDTPSATAFLYDPGTGSVEATVTPMGAARAGHTATLLPSGRVLIAGGFTTGGVRASSAEVFDLASRTFSPAGNLGAPHALHTATLLPNAHVLVVGAGDAMWDLWGGGATEDAMRPVLTTVPHDVVAGSVVTIAGNQLTGVSEGSSGTTNASASDVPVAVWMPNDGTLSLGGASAWSPTHVSWRVPGSPFLGPGLVFLVANGNAGGTFTVLAAGPVGAPCAADGACASGSCVDGVCCAETCAGACQACSHAAKGEGADGVCGSRAAGAVSPKCVVTACGNTGLCDGAGNCEQAIDGFECGSGAVCRHGTCVSRRCDGDHTLADPGGQRDCSPYRCSTDTDQCLTTCGTNVDCAGGYACSGGVCAPALRDDDSAPSCSASRTARMAWSSIGALVFVAAAAGRRRRRERAR